MEINGFNIFIYYLGWFAVGFFSPVIIFSILKIIEIYTQKPSDKT